MEQGWEQRMGMEVGMGMEMEMGTEMQTGMGMGMGLEWYLRAGAADKCPLPGDSCPPGMALVTCANHCPRHCGDLQEGIVCREEEHCEPGCRCPNGECCPPVVIAPLGDHSFGDAWGF